MINTDALDALVKRCNEMDITEQLEYLGDAIMPHAAASQLSALKARIHELEHPWRPIESYNYDINYARANCLVSGKWGMDIAGWRGDGWYSNTGILNNITHWTPLPLPQSEE